MKHLAVVIAVLSLCVSSVAPFEQRTTAAQIKELAQKHDHVALVERLSAFKLSDPKQFASQDYDYLLAHSAESEGLTALAVNNYRSVANRDSLLRSHALGHLTRIARSTGNLLAERILLNEVLVFSQDDSFKAAVKHRLALNAFESANYSETIRLLKTGAGKGIGSPAAKTREARAILGEAYRMSGDTGRAKKIVEEILSSTPKADQPDDGALSAVKSLDAIDGSDPSLGETEHWRRANVYQFNRYFDEARFHYEAVFAANRTGMHAADAVFQIGRGHAQRENYVDALAWYERVIEQYPTTSIAKDALLQAAAAYSRVGRPKEAITRYQSFIDKYPTDEKLDRAYLNIIDVLRDQGLDTDALKWCSQSSEVFKGKVPEALAIFAEARIYLSKEDWRNALKPLERLSTITNLGGANVPGGTTRNEVAFLRGFVLEKLQEFDGAIEAYLSIPDGRGEYYGWRASQRLNKLAKDEAAKSSIENKLAALSNGLQAKDAETRRISGQNTLRLTDDQQTRGRALNIVKLAVRDLPSYKIPAIVRRPAIAESEAAKRLSDLGFADEAFPDRAAKDLSLIESQWKKLPADFPIELMPSEQLAALYPAPLVDKLLRHAAPRGIDPRFMLAIVRQESRFDAEARSASAARGLMQFIHSTTTRVSNEIGGNFAADDEMYDPETAILFGAHYLSDLFSMFPDKHEAVAAAYNGGETNLKRWLGRVNSGESVSYMPEIVFGQSKDYAAKVMANYRMYQYLYDDRLALKPIPRSE